MFLLKHNITKTKRINKKIANLDLNIDLDINNTKKYKVKNIKNSTINRKKS